MSEPVPIFTLRRIGAGPGSAVFECEQLLGRNVDVVAFKDHERELKEAKAYHVKLREDLAALQERFNEQHRMSRSIRAEAKSLAHFGARKFNEKNDRIKQLEDLLRESQNRISNDWISRRDAALSGGMPIDRAAPCHIHECAQCGLALLGPDAANDRVTALTKLLRAAVNMGEIGDINADMEDDGLGWKQWYLDTMALLGPEASDG